MVETVQSTDCIRPVNTVSPSIAAQVITGPAEVHFPRLLWAGPPSYADGERGRTRLKVSVPAPGGTGFVWTTLAVTLVMGIGMLGLGAMLSTASVWTFAYGAAGGLLSMSFIGLLYHPFARTNTLEIDSRFVTLANDGLVLVVWGRRQFDDFRRNDHGSRFAPALVWGGGDNGMRFSGGFGYGLSEDEISELLDIVSSFCANTPADPEFDYVGGTIPTTLRRRSPRA